MKKIIVLIVAAALTVTIFSACSVSGSNMGELTPLSIIDSALQSREASMQNKAKIESDQQAFFDFFKNLDAEAGHKKWESIGNGDVEINSPYYELEYDFDEKKCEEKSENAGHTTKNIDGKTSAKNNTNTGNASVTKKKAPSKTFGEAYPAGSLDDFIMGGKSSGSSNQTKSSDNGTLNHYCSYDGCNARFKSSEEWLEHCYHVHYTDEQRKIVDEQKAKDERKSKATSIANWTNATSTYIVEPSEHTEWRHISCGQQFKTEDELFEHMKVADKWHSEAIYNEDGTPTGIAYHICDICGEVMCEGYPGNIPGKHFLEVHHEGGNYCLAYVTDDPGVLGTEYTCSNCKKKIKIGYDEELPELCPHCHSFME